MNLNLIFEIGGVDMELEISKSKVGVGSTSAPASASYATTAINGTVHDATLKEVTT
ncbi:MAG: hypothetical protein IKL00_00440 [Oscillospiraceae bacterium]|nr:hypothetical protein [Oscillospiraceae bacterium]